MNEQTQECVVSEKRFGELRENDKKKNKRKNNSGKKHH